MGRPKLATLLIPLSKWQQWHKPTRNAVTTTTHLSRMMPPANNAHRSYCCNLTSIGHHAPRWKVDGVFNGVMDGSTRLILGDESYFNGKNNIFYLFSLIINWPPKVRAVTIPKQGRIEKQKKIPRQQKNLGRDRLPSILQAALPMLRSSNALAMEKLPVSMEFLSTTRAVELLPSTAFLQFLSMNMFTKLHWNNWKLVQSEPCIYF